MQHIVLRALLLAVVASSTNAVGAIATFVVRKGDHKLLARMLGLSTGVMVYVALMDVIRESEAAFRKDFDKTMAAIWSSGCFFIGMVAIHVSGILMRVLTNLMRQRDAPPSPSRSASMRTLPGDDVTETPHNVDVRVQIVTRVNEKAVVCCEEEGDDDDFAGGKQLAEAKISWKTIIAVLRIAMHNIPEGITTYIVAIHVPPMGIPLAVAIAVHNVPEGLCIALPIYFQTGSRVKAFIWAVLTGFIQVLGAFIAFCLPTSLYTDFFFGVVTGVAAGMMMYVAFFDILHKARRHDPKDEWTTKFIFLGMLIMAVSLTMLISERERYENVTAGTG